MGQPKKTDQKKAWTKKSNYKRSKEIIRQIRNIFIIFCEGKNTEPLYFKSFPVNTETYIEALGLGMSRTSLVKRVIQILSYKEYLVGQDNYDTDRQIWCVFDRDVKGEEGEDEDFDNAISLAIHNGLNVAYSNDSFELWLILHDKYLDVQHTRHQYYDYLSDKLGISYRNAGKEKFFCSGLYELYLNRQGDAIRNARKLYNIQKKKLKYSEQCPCTTVYLLVEELNKCLKN